MIVSKKYSWLRTLFQIRGSSLTKTWPRLLLVFAVALVVTVVHEKYGWLHTNLTVTPFSLIGLALGIFLGFRNNTSYDRFWEGRKLWGQVVNTSRTITRQLLTLVGPGDGIDVPYRVYGLEADSVPESVREFHRSNVRRVIAYVHALRLHLRSDNDLSGLAEFLEADELASLQSETNRPIAILQRIGAEVRDAWDRGWIHALHVPVVESSLTSFANMQGGCERIKATPIPFSYNILLHRLVFVYCFGLPFGLVSAADIGPFTPVVTLLVSYAFFGLDAVGDEVEDPFGLDPNDLPLDAITKMIEINLRQRLGETDLPAFRQPVGDVLS